MRSMTRLAILSVLLVTFSVGSGPAWGVRCDTDVVPAATLLFPYFEVDLANPNSRTTLLSITNQDETPALVNVVLWTDWAVPTLSFQVYLAGYDIQNLNLRDLLVHGKLPATGKAVSPHGSLSGAPVSFPGCNDSTVPGDAPVYSTPALSESEIETLQARHTGECVDGLRAGSHAPDTVARGYVTVDVVLRCTELTPADEGYFGAGEAGVASDRNVLMGDYFLIDTGENFAQGETAVHVEAFPGEFSSGDYTFYKRYVGGSAADGREPLGTQYSFRHLVGGGFDGGTRVIVWRDTGSAAAAPVAGCNRPSWYGLSGLEAFYVFFDEEGGSTETRDTCVSHPFPTCAFPFRWATQAVSFSGEPPAAFDLTGSQFALGMTHLVLRRADAPDPEDWEVLQGWVSVISSAEDRFSVGQRAMRLDSACNPGPVKPGPEDF